MRVNAVPPCMHANHHACSQIHACTHARMHTCMHKCTQSRRLNMWARPQCNVQQTNLYYNNRAWQEEPSVLHVVSITMVCLVSLDLPVYYISDFLLSTVTADRKACDSENFLVVDYITCQTCPLIEHNGFFNTPDHVSTKGDD